MLKLNLTATQRQFINITVHAGEYWQGTFILTNNNKLMEYTAWTRTLRIEKVEYKGEKEPEQALSIQLDNFTEKTRVHLIATQFTESDPLKMKHQFDRYCHLGVLSKSF